jgi:hypothetical protein
MRSYYTEMAGVKENSGGAGAGGSPKVRNEERRARVVDPENVKRAYEQVKRNGGAAGVDGMSVAAYAARSPMLQTVLNNARLKRWGLYVPSDLAA